MKRTVRRVAMLIAILVLLLSHAVIDHVDEDDRVNSKTQGQNVLELGQRGGWLINDEPMFCLTDVCKALELTQPSKVKLDPTQNIRIAAEGVELIYEYTDEGVIVRVKKSSESPPEAANEADEAPIPTRLSEAPTEVPRDSVNWVEVTTMIFMGGLLLLELVDKIKLLKKPKK